MPINSSIGINGSVGRNGQNNNADVATVQQRLNDLMMSPRISLVVDGACGRLTKKMISDFQKSVLEFNSPDGRVDPAGKTILALNDPASEGKWAQMSIPPDVPNNGGGGSGTGGGGGGPSNAVDEIMASLRAEFSMSKNEEDAMREIVTQAVKGAAPGATSAEKVGSRSRLAFKALKGVLTFAPANSAGWVVAQYMGIAAPFLMFYGFVKALGHAMQSGSRVYGSVGAAYATAYWVHGGAKPFSCPTLVNRNSSTPEQWRQDPQNMEKCWREGWSSAWNGMEQACNQAAGRAGASMVETRAALQMALGINSAPEIARMALKQISKDMQSIDPNVANVVGILSNELRYPN